ncbi:hypothetical protein M408DRAFT_125354 [Serendipita vermifera MAFF 305830]|uniref:Transcriptional coregulator SSA1 n=1 Tax=Serendipita vermifera MAFF 305830 TaxID=933852 RepID=A0A0C3BBU3_SERVB|nr:hypothetical protein M408DRAFT_125354 [Serendipita vermifera MAFF 305830]
MSLAIGIDLGTSYSCAAVWRNGSVEIIPNDQGNRTTPSCVSFTDTELLVGDAAKNQMTRNPYNTVYGTKRLIGRQFADPQVQSDATRFPFKVRDKGGKPICEVKLRGERTELTPEEISSMILFKMKEISEAYLGCTVKDVVITVPAYFNDLQRCATKDAATIAGLNVFRVINEPTAAAMAYGLQNPGEAERECNVLVFDLGGGTFDVSLLTLEDGIFEVKATAGTSNLGGMDFDNRLVEFLVLVFRRKYNKDISTNQRALARLRRACEIAKRTLSSATETTVWVDSLVEEIDFDFLITRARFEELCQDLFRYILEPIEKVLSDSKIGKSNVHEIVLVGSSTRIPGVRKVVSDFFNGKDLNLRINPEEAVAHGAAVQAAILAGSTDEITQEILLLDVAPLSIGIDINGIMTPIIKRNTTVPTKKSHQISTNFDNQVSIIVEVYEGECSRTKDNNFLGKLELSGISPAPRGVPVIEVTFDIDANGILHVSVIDKETWKSKRVTITNERGRLSRDEIERMVINAKKYREQDEQTVAAKRDLEAYVYTLRKVIDNEELVCWFDPRDRTQLENAITQAIEWLDTFQVTRKEEYIDTHGKLERVAIPIMQRFYSAYGRWCASIKVPGL